MPDQKKPRVAILGGGTASLTTAIHLTNRPDWTDHFEDITVYQLGWRNGGKGASGRGQHGRIEEHGLHVWMGYYENSFHMIRYAYEELNRQPPNPLIEWDDAFKEHDYIVLADMFKDEWTFWGFNFPVAAGTPGDGVRTLTLWEYLTETLSLVTVEVEQWMLKDHPKRKHPSSSGSTLGRIVRWFKHRLEDLSLFVGLPVAAITLHVALRFARRMSKEPQDHSRFHHWILRWLLDRFLAWFKKEAEAMIGDANIDMHRLYILVDFGITAVRGALADGLLLDPDELDALNDEDFRAWLLRHGASSHTVDSGLVRAVYDLLFAFVDGDTARPSLAAGVAIRGILLMTFGYSGSVFYKMQAGMGDVVFGPMYQVLRNRGVRFEFFNRVKNIGLSADKKSVETIEIAIQATVDPSTHAAREQFASRVEGRPVKLRVDEYYPLIDVEHLPSWPSWPLCDWLVEGDRIWPSASRNGWPNNESFTYRKPPDYNLESYWTPWEDPGQRVLEKGRDFDICVLGIPVAAFCSIAPELVEASPKWRGMVDNILTTRTLAMQLWLDRRLRRLGWDARSPVMDAYVEPFNTWADMPQLIDREAWPDDFSVGAIAYFCGTMTGGMPPADDPSYPKTQHDEVVRMGRAWLEENAGRMWPKVKTNGKNGFAADRVLAGPSSWTATQKWDEQFWRANIDPSERYCLSVPGSIRHRIKPHDTDFDNLFCTGDWVDNPINAGCIEATVMAAMEASNAIKDFVGWSIARDRIILEDHP